ncbi:MAG: hypothetical protein ACRDKJ_05095, partial [Actinomycetota bacterium]
NSWPGLIAVILAVISFYATTYAVIALNVGWRFGYWLASATFGALMVLLSVFWIVNPVGPRGAEPRWVPIAASGDAISQSAFEEQTFSSVSQYPSGAWQPPTGALIAQRDAFSSAVATCITTDPERLPEVEREPCGAAQELMPADEDIPVIEGSAVAVQPEVEDVRFAEENGATLGQATVSPVTHDPRVADDPAEGEALADPFRLVMIFDKGAIRLPAYMALLLFLIYAGFHMFGLHRAEQRKLSPMAV